jgi:hypothetical protein
MALPTAPPPLVTVQTQKHAVNWIARSGRQVTAVNDGQALDLIRLIEASASH